VGLHSGGAQGWGLVGVEVPMSVDTWDRFVGGDMYLGQ